MRVHLVGSIVALFAPTAEELAERERFRTASLARLADAVEREFPLPNRLEELRAEDWVKEKRAVIRSIMERPLPGVKC